MTIYQKTAGKIHYFLAKRFYGAFGKGSILIHPFMIYNRKNIFIGKNVFFRNGLRIEPITKHDNQRFNPKIIIEDNVHAEQCCQIICTNKVHIEKGVVLSSYVYISDTKHTFNDMEKNVLRQDLISSQIKIGEGSFLGIGVKVICGVSIGKHVVIGANSVVTKDIPDYCMAVGTPAQIIKKYNFMSMRWEEIYE